MARKSWTGGKHPDVLQARFLLSALLGCLCLLQGAQAVILQDGTFLLCATSPEESMMRVTGQITGGVDTVHQVPRQSCSGRSSLQTRFRTADGTCNTDDDRAAAFSAVKRLMQPKYQGINSGPKVKSFITGNNLPSARSVSRAMHRPKAVKTEFTLMLMQLGQLLDHDYSIVPVATEFDDSIRCCGVSEAERYHDCMPIEIPAGDPVFKDCMEFVRSEAMTFPNGTVPQPRQHFNAITGFMDASMVYGSDRVKEGELRTHHGTGALLRTKTYKGADRLPEGEADECINKRDNHFCALAGDGRVNEQPGLTAIHTVFHLEHNRLVRELTAAYLYRIGYHWDDVVVNKFLQNPNNTRIHENMYQIVRKVLGGVWQNIVYTEWAPLILGREYMGKYGLDSSRRSNFVKEVDPSISNEFLSCAFRFGHTLVNDMMMTDKMHTLKDLFGVSQHNLDNYPNIISGLVSPLSHSEAFDSHIANSLVDHLFENNVHGNAALDLASLNIQRARDHAIPSYNDLREHFGLPKYTHWSHFGKDAAKLKALYDHPDDVDCFTGGTNEKSVRGGVVGDLFANILGQQFHDSKYGDRYFYTGSSRHYGFEDIELHQVKKLCFSKILCENAGMRSIQLNPFKMPSRDNPVRPCSTLPDINMYYFLPYLKI